MFKPVPMIKVNVLILEKYLDKTTSALGRAGVVHLVNAPAQSQKHVLQKVDDVTDIARLEGLLAKGQYLSDALHVAANQTPDRRAELLSLPDIEDYFDDVQTVYNEKSLALSELLQQSGALAATQEKLKRFPFPDLKAGELQDLDFVYFKTGRLSPVSADSLAKTMEDKALVLHEPDVATADEHVLVFAPRKGRWAIESELQKLGFRDSDTLVTGDQSVREKLRHIETQLGKLQDVIGQFQREIQELAGRYGPMLCGMLIQVRRALELRRARQFFGHTANIYCVSGWLPRDRRTELQATLNQVTHGTAVMEVIRPEQDVLVREGREQVPVQFADFAPLKPFQNLISAFGAPRYDEVEPSVFVALSFVLMFGIMFGDVGQGGIIAVSGFLLLRTRKGPLAQFRDTGYLLLFCGLSAVVFGFLYGSIFGYEGLLPGIWLRPLHDIMALFKVTIAVGIVCISIGIILNVINKLRSKNYFEGIFDKFGVIGIIFYWGAIGLGLKAAVAGTISSLEVVLIVILPLAILFLREPLYNLLCRRRKLVHDDLFTYLTESAIEVMETVTVFLGSTVSFVRVGAFALSHAALCVAIYAIAEALSNAPAAGVWIALVIIVGNMFVIFLEGLVVSIQGIRLQYYELFSKYFAGDGVLYQPFRSDTVNEDTEKKGKIE